MLIVIAAIALYAALLSTAIFMELRREKREKLKVDLPTAPGHEPDWETYDEYRKQAWQDIQSSADSFDRSMLTTSSAALGVSLVFIKDVVPLKVAVHLPLLYISWAAFALCIVVTVLSFRMSLKAHLARLDDLWLFYIKGDETALNRQTLALSLLSICHITAMVTFLVGIAFTLLFVINNLMRIT